MLRLALIGVLVAAMPAVAGPCLVPGLAPVTLTPPGDRIDQLGGVVVAAVSYPGRAGADPVNQPWEFVEAGKRAKARVTMLAPGLAVYAPIGADKELDLEDTKGHSVLRVTFGFLDIEDMPIDAAPRPTSITAAKSTPMFRGASISAVLAEAPPAGTVALLVRGANDKAKLARSWARVTDPKATRIEVYLRDRCEPEIPGTVPTKAGDKIMLAWVDAEGHVSLWSTAIEVKTK